MPVFLRWFLRLGPINPIAVRLVQGGSRRRRHLYIRTIYLGALIVCLLYLLIFTSSGSNLSVRGLAASASSAFAFVSYLQIALICLLAPVFMAGAIAQEANPRTWDILLTTPLGASEIVLGNLLGRLFFILALLFSSLPLFAMTQFFGGVPGRTIFASYIIAACAALLVGAAAISLSVSRLVGKRAVFAFYISVVTYLAVTFAVDRIVGANTGRVTWMTAINPFLALQALLDPTGYMRAPEGSTRGLARYFLETPVTTWCVLATVLSLALMIASTFTVRAGGLAGAGGVGGRGGVPWYRKMFGLGAKGAESRPARQVWSNPIAWREAAARNATFGKMLARWSFIAIGGLWGLGVVLYYHGGAMQTDSFRGVMLATVLGELGVITLVALNMSATAVAREREDGTLDLLLTTPITPAAYLSGKVRGMVAYLLPLLAVPIATLLLAGLYVALVDAGMISRQGGVSVPFTVPATNAKVPMPALLPEAGILAAVVTIPFAAFCCMVGLHWSLKSKGSIGSVVSTVLVVGAISGVIGFCAFQAGTTFELVGPVLTSLSPGSLVYAAIKPEDGLYGTVKNGDLTTARVGLSIGAIIAAGVLMAVVYGLRASLTHNFDMTVRKLAGTA
jgi:ABC-type transport system involved in multi-copper enzyme maturation permease subunit